MPLRLCDSIDAFLDWLGTPVSGGRIAPVSSGYIVSQSSQTGGAMLKMLHTNPPEEMASITFVSSSGGAKQPTLKG